MAEHSTSSRHSRSTTLKRLKLVVDELVGDRLSCLRRDLSSIALYPALANNTALTNIVVSGAMASWLTCTKAKPVRRNINTGWHKKRVTMTKPFPKLAILLLNRLLVQYP